MTADTATAERIVIEEAAPEPSTAAQVAGEIVGSFLLATLGIGIGAAAFVAQNQGAVGDVTWFADMWPTAFGWAMCIALGIYCTMPTPRRRGSSP
jgi:glycerol uptake facilitator-like aquaporin